MYYELLLRSFFDGNGDGIGDLKGATEKLKYIKETGFDGIWLMPIMSSTSYHGYSVTDFYKINPLYGTVKELQEFLNKAHELEMKVILDVPLNHVSVTSRWFLKALDGEKPYEDWFLWLENEEWFKAKRPWDDQPVWSEKKGKIFYCLFGSSCPDLNYDSETLNEEAKRILKYWLELGLDGFRFDAAKHIHDFSIEKGICEYQHEKNIQFWKNMCESCKEYKEDTIFVSEVWDDPDIVNKYSEIFGIGFNFPLSYVIKESVLKESPEHFSQNMKHVAFNAFDKERKYESGIFVTNHDMTRLVSELKTKEKALLAISILLSLPGIPFIYYGEEMGMKGIYNELANEQQLEPFMWYEIGYGIGQTEWKAYSANPPFSYESFEIQSINTDSYYNQFKKILYFRNKFEYLIRNSYIEKIKIENNLLFIYSCFNDEKFATVHNLNKYKKHYRFSSDNIVKINGLANIKGNEVFIYPNSSILVREL